MLPRCRRLHAAMLLLCRHAHIATPPSMTFFAIRRYAEADAAAATDKLLAFTVTPCCYAML